MALIGGHTVGKLGYLIQKYFIKLPQVVNKYIMYDLIKWIVSTVLYDLLPYLSIRCNVWSKSWNIDCLEILDLWLKMVLRTCITCSKLGRLVKRNLWRHFWWSLGVHLLMDNKCISVFVLSYFIWFSFDLFLQDIKNH